jgi:hypothetical protein
MAGIPFTMSSEQYAKQIREAERRGAVKALRAEAARGRAAAGTFSDPDPDRRHDGFRLLMRTADAIDAQADAIESGVVTL